MSKISLPTITNGQDLTNINNNFAKIASALNNNVLYRTNIIGEPNTISQDIDYNGFKAYNLSDVIVNGQSVVTLIASASTAATAAQASATAASSSASAANGSASSAASSAAAAIAMLSTSLLKANNLSDLQSVATAKTNLGLDQVTNTSDVNKPVSTAQQTALNLKANSATPSFTGLSGFTNTTTGSQVIKLTGNGATTPSKYLGVNNGLFSIFNSAGAASLFTVDDSGNAAIGGSLIYNSAAGAKGTAIADNANTGSIGEYITATGTAVSMTTATPANVTSISLTAGDWDVWGNIEFDPTGTTVLNNAQCSIGVTSATLASAPNKSFSSNPSGLGTGITLTQIPPMQRINVSATTTVFLVAQAGFNTSTLTTTGIIQARRRR